MGIEACTTCDCFKQKINWNYAVYYLKSNSIDKSPSLHVLSPLTTNTRKYTATTVYTQIIELDKTKICKKKQIEFIHN